MEVLKKEIKELKCPICLEPPIIPVIIGNKVCECKWFRPCLTCWRDATNRNGAHNGAGPNSIKRCPFCQKNYTGSASYSVDEATLLMLDELFPEPIDCPRGCPWKGKHTEARKHLGNCPNSFRFQCTVCSNLFNKEGLRQHINEHWNCRPHYPRCNFCNQHFIDRDEQITHLETCPSVPRCRICCERIATQDVRSHQEDCMITVITELRREVAELKASQREWEAPRSSRSSLAPRSPHSLPLAPRGKGKKSK